MWRVSFLCVGLQGTYRNLEKKKKNSIPWEGKQRRGEKKNQSCGGGGFVFVVGLFFFFAGCSHDIVKVLIGFS